MGTSKVDDMTYSELISRIAEVVTMEIKGLSRQFDNSQDDSHMVEIEARMIMLIETRMIQMRNVNFFNNDFYLHPPRLQRLVSSELQR